MSASSQQHPEADPFITVMRAQGAPELAIRTFLHHFAAYAGGGSSGTLSRTEIAAVDELPEAEALSHYAAAGVAATGRAAVVKLNGGLGTSMGLDRAKSLLPVRDHLTFLDLIARQLLSLRQEHGHPVPLVLMNSFRTDEDSLAALASYPELRLEGLPLTFLQHRIPKVMEASGTPAASPDDPELAWCPPGHGDLYTALVTSGTLTQLLDAGVDVAFVSNADNLGAVLDLSLLGFIVEEGVDFLMEVAARTPADRKGGHLCRLSDSRLALRESAQCPPDEQDEFQDIERYRFFNTNNVWVNLRSLVRLLDEHDGVLPLPTIVNRKRLDSRDPASIPVVQLESAMGAAISLFPHAAAVKVPRTRFSPVKTTDDLLGVRSDAYQLTPDWRVVLQGDRVAPPHVVLDSRYYKLVDEFDSRFPEGPPSLRACEALAVEGDVRFGREVIVQGRARVVAEGGPAAIPDGAVITGEVRPSPIAE